MLLGTQYYRPPFPDSKYWSDDLSRIRDAGLHAVQLWVVWGWVEARPGEFRYDDYDELVRLAEVKGLRVVLSTIAEIHPYWIHRVVPGSEMIDHMGQPVVSSNRCEVHQGLTPGGCFDHPGVWERMTRFLTETVCRYRSCRCLAGWDAWNELRWNVQADGYVCYCPDTLKLYRAWLDQRFGGLEGLNRAWRRRYDCWADVQPGKWHDRPYTEMMSFQHFLTWRANRHGKARYDLMKSLDPDRPVTLHGADPCTLSGGGGWNRPLDRGNDWFYADRCDGIGTSSFPVWGPHGEEFVPLRVESIASAARGKRVWMSEIQGGRSACGFEMFLPVPAAKQQRWIYHGLARGVETILFWCWRDEVFGRESGGFGLSGSDGLAAERLAALAQTGRWLAEHEALLGRYRPSAPRVGVWFSPQTYYLHAAQEGHAGRCVAAFHGYMKYLLRASIPVTVVEEEHLDVLPALDTLFLPRTLVLDDAVAEAIIRWTDAGGTLVCESECGAFDSTGVYRYPEDRFLARWGLREIGRRVPQGETVSLRLDGEEFHLPFAQWWTPLRREGEENSETLLADCPAGRGRVVAVGTYLGEAADSVHTPAFQAFLRHLAGPGPVEILSPDPAAEELFLCVREGRADETHLVFVFSSAPVREICLRFSPDLAARKTAQNLLTGEAVALRRYSAEKTAECLVTPNEWGLAVLALR